MGSYCRSCIDDKSARRQCGLSEAVCRLEAIDEILEDASPVVVRGTATGSVSDREAGAVVISLAKYSEAQRLYALLTNTSAGADGTEDNNALAPGAVAPAE